MRFRRVAIGAARTTWLAIWTLCRTPLVALRRGTLLYPGNGSVDKAQVNTRNCESVVVAVMALCLAYQ